MRPSIRLGLLTWLILPLLAINLVGAALAYILAWAPAQEALDHNLAEIAYDLRLHLRAAGDRVTLDLPGQAERVLRSNQGDETFFVVRSGGDTIAGDRDFPRLLLPTRLDMPMPYSGRLRGEDVRILVVSMPVGEQTVLIGVAETLSKRREIQARILLALLALEAVLVLASIAIVWLAVGKGLIPLKLMQAELDDRSPNDLSSMKEPEAQELRPLSKAINELLKRVEEEGKARENFLSNVAHQLRTPLAGLKTQLTLLEQRPANDADSERAIALMTSATDRMIRQTNQLLTLARSEARQNEKKREVVRLDLLVQDSIHQFVHAAAGKKIDIGFDLKPTHVLGDRFLLLDLIDNLVDNAIRYTPTDGVVTVRCREETMAALFSVEDNGPGIPLSDREKVFSRFYRSDVTVPGSGLGLAIVQDVARVHEATIELAAGAGGSGTVLSVLFPPATWSADGQAQPSGQMPPDEGSDVSGQRIE